MPFGLSKLLTSGLILFIGLETTVYSVSVEHVLVYKEEGRFAGWPANGGIWSWGDEIVVGFNVGAFKVIADDDHAIDPDVPEEPRFGRSLDGGESWSIERPSFLDRNGREGTPIDRTEPVDFSHPDFAMRLRANNDPPGHSRIYYSTDRCRTWEGPYKLPLFDQIEIMARTDYLVNGPHEAMAFVTASKEDGDEGRVFCTRTTDGGMNWDFVSWIGPEPKGFAIMPSSARFSNSKILTTLRRQEGSEHWIDAYQSEVNGETWSLLGERIASTGGSHGNPSSLTLLKDGRIALVYGYRSAPFGIRARISNDEGKSWGPEIVLRDDAGCWDLGYPASVERPDGMIVSVYYYNDGLEKERYIAASIWDPDL